MSAKKVLVTGAGGFIGSHLAERLVQLGYDVRAFVRYNSASHWGWLENSPHVGDMEIFSGDIRDFDSVGRAMKGCREVFHLAALIGIPYSYDSPLAYIKTNIEGTYNVLENARDLDIDNLVVIHPPVKPMEPRNSSPLRKNIPWWDNLPIPRRKLPPINWRSVTGFLSACLLKSPGLSIPSVPVNHQERSFPQLPARFWQAKES